MLEKQQSSHLKNGHWYPCLFCTFPFTTKPITESRYGSSLGTRAICLISLSLVGRGGGAQLLLISFVTTRLHAMEVTTEWRVWEHSSPTALGLGISAPTHPKFLSFVWDWDGAQKCFILHNQTTIDLKFHHSLARVTLTALSGPFQQNYW